LVPNRESAREVLQETNVMILQKADDLAEVKNFDRWAFRIAYFEVLSFRRNRGRDRHLLFDDQLLEELAEAAQQYGSSPDDRIQALEKCVEQLPEHSRELLKARYGQENTVQHLAELTHKPKRTVATQLFRIRRSLLDCIQRKLLSTLKT
jgi:RNA polymerase sigma-70 factor (ECF subfamily)